MTFITDEETVDRILDRRAKWAKALISGKYPQGSNRLKYRESISEGFKYCCLGVACEVFASDVNLTEESRNPYGPNIISKFYSNDGHDYESYFLPISLRKYLGISASSEAILINMNDKAVSFKIIANTIMYLPVETGDELVSLDLGRRVGELMYDL